MAVGGEIARQDVVDHPRTLRGPQHATSVLRRGRRDRKGQPDVGASVGRIGSVRLATVSLRYRLHDRKPEPAAHALAPSVRTMSPPIGRVSCRIER